ncbi:Zinc finger protein 236 [Portunus trituberculatus]|uniref:Zinc finger protein 236 n=1 Tax=Portunus trituberculatus TaxID=210409 RepID=A0A5B7CLQ9_PORTR|nr:Zinc finger protein 236 [Portunus trituberculatus]
MVVVVVMMRSCDCGVVLQGVGPRALMCPFCNKVFAGRNQHQRLRYHTLTHTGEKPHACPFCPHRARLKFNLHKHIRALHKDQLSS